MLSKCMSCYCFPNSPLKMSWFAWTSLQNYLKKIATTEVLYRWYISYLSNLIVSIILILEHLWPFSWHVSTAAATTHQSWLSSESICFQPIECPLHVPGQKWDCKKKVPALHHCISVMYSNKSWVELTWVDISWAESSWVESSWVELSWAESSWVDV